MLRTQYIFRHLAPREHLPRRTMANMLTKQHRFENGAETRLQPIAQPDAHQYLQPPRHRPAGVRVFHGRDVVVEVTKAGGFGVLGAVTFSREQLERELAWIDSHVGGRT
jgi:hypothetical protein